MPRKKKHEEHENHERWLVSYADFITLLFAFFVVMYSISSVNEGKFRVVSQSIVEALNPLIPMSATTLRFQPDNQGGPTSNRPISIDMQV
jgi:chemotaxis protein MotB